MCVWMCVCVCQKQPRASLLHNARQHAIHDSSWMAKLSTSTFTLSLSLFLAIWVCLKIVYPYTQWLMIIIPTKWLFHWRYIPFSDIPIFHVGEFYAECLNEELPNRHHRCMSVVSIVEIIHFTAAQLPCKVLRMDGCLHLAQRPPYVRRSDCSFEKWHRFMA